MRLNELAAQLVFNPDDIAKTAISGASAKEHQAAIWIANRYRILIQLNPFTVFIIHAYPTIREMSSKGVEAPFGV